MKIALAADHAGYPLKADLAPYLAAQGYEVLDLGTDSADVPVDYPKFAEALACAVVEGRVERGILICGSGVGACIAANKIPGARAAICHDTYSAHQGVEHDNMNILCLGNRVIGDMLAHELVNAYLNARFEADEPRHVRRVGETQALEQKYMSRA